MFIFSYLFFLLSENLRYMHCSYCDQINVFLSYISKMENPEEEEIPEYLTPLFFTNQTQEIFQCKGDEHVTEESPYKLIPKEKILQDYRDRAAISDFHPVRKIVEVCYCYTHT